MPILLLFFFKQTLSTNEMSLNNSLKDQNKAESTNSINTYNQAIKLIDSHINFLDEALYNIIINHNLGKETNDKIRDQQRYFVNILDSFKNDVYEIYFNNKNGSVLQLLNTIETNLDLENDPPNLGDFCSNYIYKSIYYNILEEIREFFIF